MRCRFCSVWFLLIAVAVASTPEAAAAHAFPNGSEPAVGSTVSTPPAQVVVNFDSPIEQMFAKLSVFDSSGQAQDNGTPVVSDDHRQLSIKLKPLGPGEYTVKWTVVAEDGHRTEGSFNFTVAGS